MTRTTEYDDSPYSPEPSTTMAIKKGAPEGTFVSKCTGIVKWFNDAKGFGFITRDDNKTDVFVHHSGIAAEGFRTLSDGAAVSFDLMNGPKGMFASSVVATK